MIQYLRQPSSNIDFDPLCSIFCESPCTILELGSGNGYVGAHLAKQLFESGRTVDTLVLTDLPDVCPLLEENISLELRNAGDLSGCGVGHSKCVIAPFGMGCVR